MIIITLLRWALGLLCIGWFFTYISTSAVTGIVFALLAIMLIPPLSKLIYSKIPYSIPTRLLIVSGIILFVVAMASSPKTAAENAAIAVTPSPTSVALPTKLLVPTNNPTPQPSDTPIPTDTPEPIYYPPTPTPTVYVQQTYFAPAQNIQSSGTYPCDCGLTCTEISSCAEAQYELNTCGCYQRDADHDGTACDGAPLHCQN